MFIKLIIISTIINTRFIRKNTIKITGKKDRVRELIHVDDVVNALMLSFNSKTDNEVFNVSNPQHLTPKIIISKISKVLNKSLEIKEIDGYKGDQTYITSKINKLQNIGWTPKINIEEGIKEFVNNI